jgi:hypothetical protein
MKAIDSFSYTKDPRMFVFECWAYLSFHDRCYEKKIEKKQEYLTEAKGNIEEVKRYVCIS